jgi:hypothetical protein
MALTKVSRGLLSTSIVDNGNATAITIDSSENVSFTGAATFSAGITATVGPSATGLKVAATGSGDAFSATPLAAGNGVVLGSLNSTLADYEPLRIIGESIQLEYRTGVGTSAAALTIASTGAATFSGTVTADGLTVQTTNGLNAVLESTTSYQYLQFKNSGYTENYIDFTNRDFHILCDNVNRFTINGTTGAATFSGAVNYNDMYSSDSAFTEFNKSVAVSASTTTTVLTFSQTQYNFLVGGTITLVFVDEGYPDFGITTISMNISAGAYNALATTNAAIDIYSTVTSGSASAVTATMTSSKTGGVENGTINIRLTTGASNAGTCKVRFVGFKAGAVA